MDHQRAAASARNLWKFVQLHGRSVFLCPLSRDSWGDVAACMWILNYFTSSDPHHDIYRFVTGISSGILSGISSGILSGISSGILSGILFGISHGLLSGISSGIPSDILSGISSGIRSAS